MTTLSRWREHGNGFPALRNHLSELFDIDDFFSVSGLAEPMILRSSFGHLPAANVRESDQEYLLEMAVPGMTRDDFQINTKGGALEIKVEKEAEDIDERGNYRRREYNYNSFYRSFAMPENIEVEKISAEYADGILKVHLPVKEAVAKNVSTKIEVS